VRVDNTIHRKVFGNIVISKYEFPLGNYQSLQEIRQDGWEIFTPALLYLYGGFNDEMLLDFMDLYGKEIKFYHYKFSRKLFSGFEVYDDLSWDYVLWFVNKDQWIYFEIYSKAIVIKDPARQAIRAFDPHLVVVYDPLILDRDVEERIYSFSMRSNQGGYTLVDANKSLDKTAFVVKQAPVPENSILI